MGQADLVTAVVQLWHVQCTWHCGSSLSSNQPSLQSADGRPLAGRAAAMVEGALHHAALPVAADTTPAQRGQQHDENTSRHRAGACDQVQLRKIALQMLFDIPRWLGTATCAGFRGLWHSNPALDSGCADETFAAAHLHEDDGVLEGAHDGGVVQPQRHCRLHARPRLVGAPPPLLQRPRAHLRHARTPALIRLYTPNASTAAAPSDGHKNEQLIRLLFL